MLTELQKKKLSHYFQTFDVDKNGVLEKSDFDRLAAAYAETYQLALDSETYQYICSLYAKRWELLAQEADTNADNKVSLDEWIAHHDKLLNNLESDFIWMQAANRFFEIQNSNKDGFLSLDEYKTMYTVHGIGDESLATEIFAKLDFDGDGKIRKNDILNLIADFYLSDNPQAPGNLFFGYYE